SPKTVHIVCLFLAGIGLIAFPQIQNKYLLFLPMTGFGIAWASMMGVPYLMVVNQIPKERYGVYMGIINMMIVIPMILQTTTFGWVLHHLLDNNAGRAIGFAGILLIIACLATFLIPTKPLKADEIPLSSSGH
ncbi:MAG TPA: hypothetical protein VG842_05990, partial [Sediminibacterium sp.]|nr:hypothetical protein [Sediminibacterium sp.]